MSPARSGPSGLPPDPVPAAGLLHAGRALRRVGYHERAVTAFYGVPLVSDAHHVAPPYGRERRGLGALIALILAGEEVERADVALLDDEAIDGLLRAGLLVREGNRLRACASISPFCGGTLVAADRLDARGPTAVRAPDLSAWNVAACLPPRTHLLVDAGCGAGALTVAAARRSSGVVGYDIDERALRFAAVNLALNECPRDRVTLLRGDVRDPPPEADQPGSCCAFNAPLLTAPMAGEAPLYLHAPGADELPLAVLRASGQARSARELLCHTQLPDALWEAAVETGCSGTLALEFARSPEGIPHALLSLRQEADAPHRARVRTPLGPALPHLHREVLDRLHATQALLDRTEPIAQPLRPAPWLLLSRSEQYLGNAFQPRQLRFGEAILDDADERLLRLCDGRPVSELGLQAEERERLGALARRGLLVI